MYGRTGEIDEGEGIEMDFESEEGAELGNWHWANRSNYFFLFSIFSFSLPYFLVIQRLQQMDSEVRRTFPKKVSKKPGKPGGKGKSLAQERRDE